MKNINSLFLMAFTGIALCANAQTPEITSWMINTTGATGYGSLPSNVQQVQYSASNVYISASSIPSYSIGPWVGNPNIPVNMSLVYKITRSPQQNTATATDIGLGHVGVWTNGVSIFNVSDAMSYNNAGVWNRNAYYWEGSSFDNCLGHPAPGGEYHHHVSPKCLYNTSASTVHSPIIGYAFDGFPIYGAYGYANTNGTGGIKRMESSYSTTTTVNRTNGPAVSSTYPIGCYIEDYAYTAASGDLDQRNGRFCVTPEYPNGTYAYFVTLDAALSPQFPYTIFGTYYGVVQSGNTANGGHNTVTESVTTYSPGGGTTTGIKQAQLELSLQLYPNPTSDNLFLFIDPIASNNFTAELVDVQGRTVLSEKNIQPAVSYSFDVTRLSQGIYTFKIANDSRIYVQRVVISR